MPSCGLKRLELQMLTCVCSFLSYYTPSLLGANDIVRLKHLISLLPVALMAPHAAPSREQPTASTDLEAGRELKLGEFDQAQTALSLSEARIVIQRVTDARRAAGQPLEETDNLTKARDYLEIFSIFKNVEEAELSDQIMIQLAHGLHNFEKSQLKTLAPTCADEAKALIPSLEKKVEDGSLDESVLDSICAELQRLKRQAELAQ